jgi:cellulose synthase-like protein
MYVGIGCLFHWYTMYGFDLPHAAEYHNIYGQTKVPVVPNTTSHDEDTNAALQWFGKSKLFMDSIAMFEYPCCPLQDLPSVQNDRLPGALLSLCLPLDTATMAVISC